MGLVVKVELQGNGVYLAGERVSCTITLSNNGNSLRTIAWMGAQVHCQCSYRQDLKLGGPSAAMSSPITDTTFVPNRDEPGLTLASTPTVVLLCNLTLQPQENRTVLYSDTIPVGGPPTFAGRMVQYKYKMTVGAQELGCPTHSVRIPFRVLTAPESLTCHTPTQPLPSDNPFLSPKEQQHPSLEEALHILTTEASRRATMSYTLKSAYGPLGRLSLFKSSYKLGEDIIGSFDFSCDTVTCLQLFVVLQSLEEINEEFVPPSARVKANCMAHAHHIECCHNTKQTHFTLPVPQHVTQSFKVHAVKHSWQLHFEFVISKGPPAQLLKASATPCLAGSKVTLWEGLQPVAMESMTWNLPITILPTLPLQQTHKPHTLNL